MDLLLNYNFSFKHNKNCKKVKYIIIFIKSYKEHF